MRRSGSLDRRRAWWGRWWSNWLGMRRYRLGRHIPKSIEDGSHPEHLSLMRKDRTS